MPKYYYHIIFILFYFFCTIEVAEARTDKYRCMWREDPATTMVIGWNQISGSNTALYYDTQDRGQDAYGYKRSQKADRTIQAKGMNNHFVRLTGLIPNTVYYFVIKDSDSVSKRMSFRTAPDSPNERLSIISGGDSRNHRDARRSANKMVAKLRPHCITFGGDMTGGDIEEQWKAWFDDWQLTISDNGHLTPIIVARGNHEASNQSLVDLFDVKAKDLYYALTLGGNLLRVYTLNSMIPTGGSQKDWLLRDLSTSGNVIWKMAQYHHSIRPHNSKKSEQNDQLLDWATAFYKYRVNLVVESDVHTVKTTYPIRPSKEPGSDEGFIRDEQRGTVYVGEGCWGAPLRQNNDTKAWTRASGSFNQFKWIFVDQNKIEVRTIKTDGSDRVAAVSPYNIFDIPNGINIWNPPTGDVLVIEKPGAKLAPTYTINNTKPPYRKEQVNRPNNSNSALVISDLKASRNASDVIVRWTTTNEVPNTTFEVQRSTDGGTVFKPIANVPGKGRGNHSYDYNDRGFAANNGGSYVKYRVKHTQGTASQFSNASDTQIPGSVIRDANITELRPDPVNQTIKARYSLAHRANVTLHLVDANMIEAARLSYPNQLPGNHEKSLDLSKAPNGKYTLLVKANGEMIQRFHVNK